MKEIVAALTAELRRSPHVNHRSGVSVRYSIGNLETLAAAAVRRAARGGRARGGAARLRSPRGAGIVRGAGGVRHDRGGPRGRDPRRGRCAPPSSRCSGVGCPGSTSRRCCSGSTTGFAATTSDLTPAAELLAQFGELPGLGKLLERLGVEEESPGVAASALEFALEGLHLSRRLNKDGGDAVATYTGPAAS